jgi:hypothetical protein
MGHESLAHKQLKKQAKELLKKLGFSDSEIFEEYPIKGFPRDFIIDVAGISLTKRAAVECGQLDRLKEAVLRGQIGELDKPFDEVIHLPYPDNILSSEFYDESSTNLSEQKRYLISAYNEEVYEKLKDDADFKFKKCQGPDDANFQIGRFTPWMVMPTATGTLGKQLMYEVNFVMFLEEKDFGINVNAGTNKAIGQFIKQMILKDNQQRLLELFRRLPDNCFIQPGYKFKDAKHRAPPYPRNWEDTKPYLCNKLTVEQLEDIINYLEFYLMNGSKFEQYPVIEITRFERLRKEDLSTAFKLLKQVYVLLFSLDTIDLRYAKEISSMPDFGWDLDMRDYNKILEEARRKFPNLTMEDLKKIIRLIKKTGSDKPE